MGEVSRFQYLCSMGHEIQARKEVMQCPVCFKGQPCPGSLKRVGPGSRKVER